MEQQWYPGRIPRPLTRLVVLSGRHGQRRGECCARVGVSGTCGYRWRFGDPIRRGWCVPTLLRTSLETASISALIKNSTWCGLVWLSGLT
ncbi:hypothetical protein SLA2020_388320 [Shorea laevis]